MDLDEERRLIELANDRIPFAAAARLAGLEFPAPRPSGTKTWCPFGEIYHPDGGEDKAFRVYEDHGFCFACWQWYSPVRLVADVTGVSSGDAAVQLLATSGIKPVSLAQHWAKLTRPPDPDGEQQLAQALRIALETDVPGWDRLQYDPGVADRLSRCLELIALVGTPEDCRRWLEGCKRVMVQTVTTMRQNGAEVTL